ncbi:uncharacterized protein LOC131301030 [Rhododendron vialii]|uniref:uncharacterized protein LOC131301030 n=1 Tax=Rhododendron vialii TaxID=182163 RepID=UPI00265F88B0|nr:uncharacterized protein LOC131301030 [Rhododendron vialii]
MKHPQRIVLSKTNSSFQAIQTNTPMETLQTTTASPSLPQNQSILLLAAPSPLTPLASQKTIAPSFWHPVLLLKLRQPPTKNQQQRRTRLIPSAFQHKAKTGNGRDTRFRLAWRNEISRLPSSMEEI